MRKQNKISRQTLSCVEEAKLLGGMIHLDRIIVFKQYRPSEIITIQTEHVGRGVFKFQIPHFAKTHFYVTQNCLRCRNLVLALLKKQFLCSFSILKLLPGDLKLRRWFFICNVTCESYEMSASYEDEKFTPQHTRSSS